MSPLLEFSGAGVEVGKRLVIGGVDLRVHPGEIVGLVGANGSGKTSLMRAGLGLLPAVGEVRLAGRPPRAWSERERASRVGWLTQDRRVGWNMSAVEVAALGAPFAAPAQARARAREALERVGLGGFADRGVLDMSAGERARVLFARLLVARAPLILADEPAAGIDIDGALLVMDILREEASAGAGVFVSLHDLALAARGCDRLVVLAGGRVAAQGSPSEALTPEALSRAFNVEGEWINAPGGPSMAIERRRPLRSPNYLAGGSAQDAPRP